jgi:UDP-glucose:(heptosyl)LPS alpha-1,3-glucosyltransferase
VHGLARVPGVDTFHALDPIQAHWLSVQYPVAWQASWQRWNPRHRSILELERKIYGPDGPRRIIVQSDFDRELLQRLYRVAAERLAVVPNGVDLQEFSVERRERRPQVRTALAVPDDVQVVLFAGMDFRRKGLDTLIQAIPRLKSRSALVLVAGKGRMESYAALAARSGVADRIRFLGQVSGMADLYVAADVLALPTRYDPFASVVLESLACGTPVVTSRCGGGALAVDEPLTGAVIRNPSDPVELAEALNQQLAMTIDRRVACANRANRFTAESYARQTLSVLESLFRRRAA